MLQIKAYCKCYQTRLEFISYTYVNIDEYSHSKTWKVGLQMRTTTAYILFYSVLVSQIIRYWKVASKFVIIKNSWRSMTFTFLLS